MPPRPCAHCGTVLSVDVGGRTASCSDECRLARKRSNWRKKNYRRRAARQVLDVDRDYERELRRQAKRCPMPDCDVKLSDQPFLPNSKELDHMVPINMGGTHTIGNVRIICRRCNERRPKDGSDYVGPVTLWAEVAGVAVRRPRVGDSCCGVPRNQGLCRRCGGRSKARLKRELALLLGEVA